MPKMKTKRAAAKRFKLTGGGRIRRSTAGKQHIMRGKSANRLRRLKKNSMVHPSDEPRMMCCLPAVERRMRPPPVALNRFEAARFDFILGI